jgi:putative membrane protein
LLAGAVALASLVHDFGPREVRIAITALLLLLALVLTVGAYGRWERAERALRENRSLPMGVLPRLVIAGIVLVIAGAAVMVFLAETGR